MHHRLADLANPSGLLYVAEHLETVARLHRENRYDRVTDTVEQVTGRPAESVEEFDLMKAKILGRRQIRSNWRMVATGVFRGRRGCAGRMMDGSAWLVAVLRCPVTSLGEQVAVPRDELLDGLRGPAGDFLDRGVTRSYRFSRCSRAMVAICSSTYDPSPARESTCSAHVSHGTST